MSDTTVSGLNVGTASTHGVGGFVAQNTASGSITTSSVDATTTVTGYSTVGGFAGVNVTGGVLTSDTSSGSVTATGDQVGGFAGWNQGSITNAKATGHTTGKDDVGGLVGWNDGNISSSSATGETTGTTSVVGGLVGYNSTTGVLKRVYATGTVDGTAATEGGLIGFNFGNVTNAYATGSVGISTTQAAGGLVDTTPAR